jgi:hypothetical protein
MPPPVSIDKYSNVLKCRLKEVIEICSSISTIHANSAYDVAFVFHINTLEFEIPNRSGMSRVFYTRYRYDDADRLHEVYCHLYYPFSNIGVESYPY